MHPITQLECIQFIVDFDLHISSIEIFLVFNHLKALPLPRMSPNAWCPYRYNLSSFLLQVYKTKGLGLLKFLAVASMSYYYYYYYYFVVKQILRQSKTIILRTGAWYNN